VNGSRILLIAFVLLWLSCDAFAQEIPISDATQECLDCHAVFHPGIVADWQSSRHARVTTPAEALTADELQRRSVQRK
jgi:hydroxylamine dehydrogenase